MPDYASFNNLADEAAARAAADKALDTRVAALESAPAPVSFSHVTEVATFDENGEYVLASAPSGIMAGTVPMLSFDGLVQDGLTETKRFDVVNVNGVPKKLKLYSYTTTSNFAKVGSPQVHHVGGESRVFQMSSDSVQVGGSNAQTVSASSVYNGSSYPAYLAVDKDNNTFWASQGTLSTTPQWWRIDFVEAVSFDAAQIKAKTDGYHSQSPSAFQIQASSDNFATYDVIYSGTGVSWQSGEAKQFENPDPTKSYKSFRVYVTASVEGNVASFADFDLISNSSGYKALAILNGSSFVTVSDASLALGTSDFTVEMWVYTPNWDGYNCLFGNSNADYPGVVFGAGSYDGVYIYAGGWVVHYVNAPAAFSFNQWQHIAYVRSGSTVKTYVNGVLAATGSTSGNFTNSSWGIGAQQDGDESWPGYIRNLRITKAARYTANFTPFSVSSDVTQLADDFASSTVLKASFNSAPGGNITWSVGTALLPAAGTKCIVSYFV